MKIVSLFTIIVVSLTAIVCGKKWLKHPSIVVLKKGEVKEIPTKDLVEKRTQKHHHHATHAKTHRRLNFGETDSLPYSSPFSRPYHWNMYTDGPYGWGPARRRRDAASQWPHYSDQQYNAQVTLHDQQTPQAAESSTNTLTSSWHQGPAQALKRKAPETQQPQERTWVDKMGVKWTTKKVNDYKWGEREPGITMDEYAGGPFGFDDVKRSQIQRVQLKRSDASQARDVRSWVDKYGAKWNNRK